MPLVSRRGLISAGIAAGATVLLPQQLFSGNSAARRIQSGPLSAGGWVEPAENTIYSGADQEKILGLARHALTELFAGKTLPELQPEADLLGLPAVQRVNITLRYAGRIRGSMSGPGSNLGKQVVESVFRAAMDRRYGGHLTRGEIADTILEVWIQTGSTEISPGGRFAKNPLFLGVEGVEIEGHGKSAYYKPSVAITSRYKTDTALFEALCKKARLETNAWQLPDVTLRRTQWLCLRSVSNTHFFGQEVVTKSRVPISVTRCIAESVSYLVRNQDIDGSTAYLYDPITDVFVTKKTNLVRSAGSLFALSQVLESDLHIAAKGTALKSCTVQMARGLLNRTSLTDEGRRVVQEDRLGEPPDEEAGEGEKSGAPPEEGEKARDLPEEEERTEEVPGVGATALLAAALGADTLRREFAEEYQQLYRSVVSAQKPDGRFVTYFGETEEGERAANYYSGEALVVLAMEAERGNTEALEMCRRAFNPYLAHFRHAPTTAFVGWHVNVWSRMALLTGNHDYADFAFEQTDWLLQTQIKSHRDLRWVGGFSQTGAAPQFSSIVFLEAAVRALKLASKRGNAERTRKYSDCVRSGLNFCRQLRLEETPSTLLANPMRCKGGVALGLIDRRVRCDVVQHFITLCLTVKQTESYLV